MDKLTFKSIAHRLMENLGLTELAPQLLRKAQAPRKKLLKKLGEPMTQSQLVCYNPRLSLKRISL